MTVFLSFVILVLLGQLLTTLINAVFGPHFHRLKPVPADFIFPKVSVLIPARNEGDHINACLKSMQAQTYPDFEVWILDDESTDKTAEHIQTAAQADARFHYIKGNPLPEGWVGKNWACYQLSKKARGDIFIFTDADNHHHPEAIQQTVLWMKNHSLDLLSAFPQQKMVSLSEKLVIPSVYMTVYTLLPLWLTKLLPFPSLAAANGQWLALKRKAYEEIGGHQAVQKNAVEDTALARLAKKNRKRILTVPGTDRVFGRMYEGWSGIRLGFGKNLFGLMQYQLIPFLMLLVLMAAAYITPYLLLFSTWFFWAAAAVVINLCIRFILCIRYKDPWISMWLHPVGIALMITIGIQSVFHHYRGTMVWKERKLSQKGTT